MHQTRTTSLPGGIITPPSWGTYSAENPPGPDWTPYGPDSPFNTLVGPSPAVDPRDADIRAHMNSFGYGNKPHRWFGNEADSAWDFDHPIYWSQSTDPLFTLNLNFSDPTTPQPSPYRALGNVIHIPDAARYAAGTDQNMAVIDQTNNMEYSIVQATSKPSGGGSITGNLCGKTPNGPNVGHGLYCDGTAAWQAQAAGIIRPEELAAGQINHALICTMPGTTHAAPRIYPTDTTYGTGTLSPDSRAPKIGQRFYLNYSDGEIASLGIPTWQKTILTALAHYGMYVTDTNKPDGWDPTQPGTTWRIQLESGSSRTSFGLADPWKTLGQSLGLGTYFEPDIGRTLWVYNFEAACDWTRLVALLPLHSLGYGR